MILFYESEEQFHIEEQSRWKSQSKRYLYMQIKHFSYLCAWHLLDFCWKGVQWHDYCCSLQPRPSIYGTKMSIQYCLLLLSLNGHRTAFRLWIQDSRSLYETWKQLQTPQLNLKQLKISPEHLTSSSAQDWVSPQPFFCASSVIIRIHGNRMLTISWKVKPWMKMYTWMEKPMLKP